MLIVLQDYPDPDAIGAAVALKELAHFYEEIPSSIACGGFVGRPENRALVSYLDLNVLSLNRLDLSRFDVLAMVDTQPGTGNNSLSSMVVPQIVIDHHPVHKQTRSSMLHDVRSHYGATCTILHQYLMEAGVEISVPLATALVYGVRSDTHDLGRDTTQADITAYLALYPVANKRVLSRIVQERLPRDYFEILDVGLRNAATYGKCIFTSLGPIRNPDMIGEVADLLLRNEESSWALCCGFHGNRVLMSLRASDPNSDAGKMIQRIVEGMGTGGGHRAMAGGQIPLPAEDPDRMKQVVEQVRSRFLKYLKEHRAPAIQLVSLL